MAPTAPEQRQQPSPNRPRSRPFKIIAHLRTHADYVAFNSDPRTIARRNQMRVRAKALLQQGKNNMHSLLQGIKGLDIKRPSSDDLVQKMVESHRASLTAAEDRKMMKMMLKMGSLGMSNESKEKAKMQNERLMGLFEGRYIESLETPKAGEEGVADEVV